MTKSLSGCSDSKGSNMRTSTRSKKSATRKSSARSSGNTQPAPPTPNHPRLDYDHTTTGQNRNHAGGLKARLSLDIAHHDTANVQQWAQSALPEISLDMSGDYRDYAQPMSFCSSEPMHSFVRPHPHAASEYTEDHFCESSGSGSHASSFSSQGHGFGLSTTGMDQDYDLGGNLDDMYYAMPQSAVDVAYTSPLTDSPAAETYSSGAMSRQGSTGYQEYPNAWSQGHSTLSDDVSLAGSHPMSVGSSRYGCSPTSQSHLGQLDTTLSIVMLDDAAWASASTQNGDNGPFRTQGLPETLDLPSASYPCDQNTIRPSHVNPRPNIIDADMWQSSQLNTMDPGYNGLHCPYPISSRRSSDGESTANARKDPLYQAVPKEDKLFHCPFEREGCTHPPEKLKCNYDKHLDSHLKPYVCNRHPCNSLRFSSTACLLRHEREAHALHGHGVKPYSCYFPDCERAQPLKGFPRQWNLRDHMKRVHNYTVAEPASPKSDYPSPPNSPDSSSRRKRSPDAIKATVTKKPKAGSSSKSSRRESQGSQEALKAHLDRSFANLSAKDLARLQRCHEQGRDIFKDIISNVVY